MDNKINLTLDNTQVLAEVCGVNDYNLRIIEKLLGGKIFTKGNELIFEPLKSGGKEQFVPLIEGIVNAIVDGFPSGPDLVTAIWSTLEPDDQGKIPGSEEFRDSCLAVPGGFGKVFPRTAGQMRYIRGLEKYEMTLCIGPAGTGKTFLAVAWAIREVLSKARRKLVLTRPVVEAGENLGFLPGDLYQKINPYLRPLYDAMEAIVPFEVIKRMEEARTIEIAPLAYMRGRSLNHCVVILDEAQNTTTEQMKMFLTRMGEGTAVIITGDVTQIDLPRKSDSGLVDAVDRLSGVDGIFICKLETQDVVRNPLVKKIIQAYE